MAGIKADIVIEKDSSMPKSWFLLHKWWSAAIIFVVLLFVLALLFGGWYSLWSKALYQVGADNTGLIAPLCLRACAAEDSKRYCEDIQSISYGQDVRATFLKGNEEEGYKTVFTFTQKLQGSCDNIARGYLTAKNKEGELEDFSVSFPYVEFPKCPHDLCSS